MRELLTLLRAFCAKLPDAEEYVMVHHPAFRVGKKPFAIAGMDEGKQGPTLSFNWGKDAQPQFLDEKRFSRTHYIGQHGWVTVPIKKLKKSEIGPLVIGSYRRVASKKQLARL